MVDIDHQIKDLQKQNRILQKQLDTLEADLVQQEGVNARKEALLRQAVTEVEAAHKTVEQRNQELKLSNEIAEAARAEVEELNQHLEQMVAERTAALANALEQLQHSQLQVIQSEKMAALGNLVAGVAHEINNPVGFIEGNIRPALDYINDLFGLIDLYQTSFPNPGVTIENEIEDLDLEFIRTDLPKLVNSMRLGATRISDISNSLRTFSRADSDRPVPFDIHAGIDSTILILKHRLKSNGVRPEILVNTQYGDLPPVECYAGQLNQVFMNLLANAIDALEESNQSKSLDELRTNPNQITVQTELVQTELVQAMQKVQIRIQDNGIGMSAEVQKKIFEHLFTTKGVGKGTGLGLAIARQIVIEKHQGSISVHSSIGKGTEFLIIIPVKAAT